MGAWAFAEFAEVLSRVLWVDVAETPRKYNYLLHMDRFDPNSCPRLFIPWHAIQIASDKRKQADIFSSNDIPTPETHLVDKLEDVYELLDRNRSRKWCLKYPLACGGSGHRMLTGDVRIPADWPRPFLVQEFIAMDKPEVYRTYCAGGEIFGWIARRFPPETRSSPWVAHVRGARYEREEGPPEQAIAVAHATLSSVELLSSFGCVDLIPSTDGDWLVLEVGTDGMFNHVDRDINDADLEKEIQKRITEAFWKPIGTPPWHPNPWDLLEK